MHELAACKALLDQVTEVAHANNATRVTGVTVLVGPLSGIEAHLLKQAFTIARAASIAPEAELTIETDPVIIVCRKCDERHETRPNKLRCPTCGLPCPELASGDALKLAGISVDRSEPDPIASTGGTNYV